MSEQYYDEETIDLKELILTYVKRWKLLLIVSACVALAVFLGIKIFINKNATAYVAEFEFTYPGSENGTYPNGKQFRYQDLVSEDVIKAAIASNSNFSKFSAADIVKGKLLCVAQKTRTVTDENKNETEIAEEGMFYFTISANYFGGQAETFLEAILKVAADDVKENADSVDYQFNLVSFDKADTFAKKIEYLSAQKNYINSIYNSWISEYGDQFTVKGTSINRYRENASFAFTDKVYSELLNELQRRQYVLEKTANDELACKLQIEIYNEQIEDIDKKIEGLTLALEELRKNDKAAETTSIVDKTNETYYYTQIAKLTEEKVDIERQINHIEIQIANLGLDDERSAFLDKLVEVRNALQEETDILSNTLAPAVYDEKTVAELEPVEFTVIGAKNALLYAGIAFAGVYLVVGFFCFLLRDEEDEDKKKKVKTA